jgi:hypothetical protein
MLGIVCVARFEVFTAATTKNGVFCELCRNSICEVAAKEHDNQTHINLQTNRTALNILANEPT